MVLDLLRKKSDRFFAPMNAIFHAPLSSHRVLRGQTSCTNSDSWHMCGGDLCALFHLRVASVYGDVTSLDCGTSR